LGASSTSSSIEWNSYPVETGLPSPATRPGPGICVRAATRLEHMFDYRLTED
jgi:hypothetical protein